MHTQTTKFSNRTYMTHLSINIINTVLQAALIDGLWQLAVYQWVIVPSNIQK